MSAPLFSIVTPVYEPPVDVLADTIASVLAQDFEAWEWILVDDCSPTEAVRELTVENFPVLVINDCVGGDLYAVPDLEAALG